PRRARPPAGSLAAAVRLTAARPAAWVLAGVFAAYSASFMSVFGFLPTMLVEEMGMSTGTAAVLGAVAVMGNAVGNLLAGGLARRGVPRWALVALPCVGLSLTAAVVFSHGLPFAPRYAAAILYSVVGGLLPATVMGALPAFAPRPDLVGTMSGFVMQGSNIGQLAGPPLLAAVVAGWGWPAAPVYIAAATGLGLLLALRLRPLERGLGAR
ncbi:MFS transporter, partial [Azospirillum sp. RWY-5-1]